MLYYHTAGKSNRICCLEHTNRYNHGCDWWQFSDTKLSARDMFKAAVFREDMHRAIEAQRSAHFCAVCLTVWHKLDISQGCVQDISACCSFKSVSSFICNIYFSFVFCRTAHFLHAKKSFGKSCEIKEGDYGTGME